MDGRDEWKWDRTQRKTGKLLMFIVLGRDVERSFETVGTKINSKKGKFYFVSKNAHSWHLNEMNDIIATVKIPSSFFFFIS